MPCNADYMKPSTREQELSRIACLLDELDGCPFNCDHWNGYHPVIYRRSSTVDADKMVSELCSRLQDADVTKYSLEMQMWWRDHKEVDKRRVELELSMAEDEKARRFALSKLTDYEKKLLGLK